MARSRRNTPIIGITKARSEKRDKQIANRRLRRIVRECLRLPWYCLTDDEAWIWYIAVLEYDDMPLLREASNVYGMDKDGKRCFDVREWPELMRK